jgi:hypothetical protein
VATSVKKALLCLVLIGASLGGFALWDHVNATHAAAVPSAYNAAKVCDRFAALDNGSTDPTYTWNRNGVTCYDDDSGDGTYFPWTGVGSLPWAIDHINQLEQR